MAPLPRPRAMVDDAIYGARAAFEPLAEVITAPGAAIDHDMLVETGAEILITRSVTRVDAALLEGTRVRFVGTATAGVDHVDQAALRARDIAFASAPGCNAPAVVHWVLTALTSACARAPARWRLHAAGGRVGVAIVGYGNVGRRLARRLRRLGATLWISDPPLARALERGDATLDARDRTELCASARALERAAVVSLHVPLTPPGERDPTLHLLRRETWPDAAVINTSRGAVVENAALAAAGGGQAALDVWEGEPELAWELLRPGGPALFASHHVAGYSQASKQSATRMIQGALARRLGVPAPKDTREDAAPRPALRPALDGCAGPMDALARCLRASCDLLGDDRRTRALLERPAETRARAFEALRRGYDLRREPGQLALDDALLARLRPWLARPIFPGGAPLLDALAAVGFWREP